MSRIVLLDSGPLGLATNPGSAPRIPSCLLWVQSLSSRGFQVGLPEIADYEVRRELLRADKSRGLRNLDQLKSSVVFYPITTAVMLRAAALWASVRKQGRPTAPDPALDGDVILAAQGQLLAEQGHLVVVATLNVDHLARFLDARLWSEIT
ncbi:MAG TPA: nucleic acid-binding protein [Methylomirabilota bacterium]|nr:nucleic acid-binding protein [Methylomirabilota bacterium]